MATTVDHRRVNLARNNNLALPLPESFKSSPSDHARHHDVYGLSTESSSRASIMSTEDIPMELSRTLTTGSEGWSDSEDDDDSSVTSDTSHARIARRPHFPPVLPSVNSSSSISKSLPQKLAATISAVEGSGLAYRPQTPSKSQSPPARFRRVKSPPLSSQTQRESLISNALQAQHLPDSHSLPNPLHVPQSWQTRQTRPLPHGIDEVVSGQKGAAAANTELGFKPYVWKSFDMESEVSDDEYNQSGLVSFDDDEDSGQDDASSRVSRSFQRLTTQFSRLRDQRTSLREIFNGVQLKRTHVQEMRHVKDDATLAFMTAVQGLLPDNPGLDKFFKDMRDAQLRCQEAEQRFDDMLDELQHGEVELELEEQRFYTAAAGIDSTASDDESDDDNCPQVSENPMLRGITGDRPVDIHPLFEELREASRNIQLARELLVNTQMKRKALSAGKSHLLSPDSIQLLESYGEAGKKRALELKRSGVMSQDDVEMLQDYDILEQKALSDIDHYTKETMRLENECREKRVMPQNTPFQQEGFGFNPVYADEIRLGDDLFDRPPKGQPKTLAHPVFPKLLSNPIYLLDEFPQTAQQSLRQALSLPPGLPSRQMHIDNAAREVNIHSLLKEVGEQDGDKRGYINRWLLHKLHLSSMEAELLWSTFHSRLKILNIDRWQQDVLHLWWKDQAANLPPAQFEGVYEDRSSASINPRLDLPSRCYSDSHQLDRMRLWDIEEAWS
ncbi:uncharacterized protein GGS22DRAFT_173448 [Annulohypoxylon maeteangense]|uniref:uncharacterized protein n=1 Tax=Annulohypoxylon maeteangense TaxID=1927788 RepID=UPI00200798C2|nr:uncharacterized protein GGS22DRAFT_173448 [Annulohypoxylon maeteangense]KAI0881142.1 hypothetical protein GGS22DRAFT_173448 [Annulohypoxylon maeteangense]